MQITEEKKKKTLSNIYTMASIPSKYISLMINNQSTIYQPVIVLIIIIIENIVKKSQNINIKTKWFKCFKFILIKRDIARKIC